MKLLHVIASLELGGAEALLKDLAIFFKKEGIDITIIVLMKKEDSVIMEQLKRSKIDVIYCPVPKKISFRNILFLTKHLMRNKYDIIHTHLTWDIYILAFLNLLFRNKLALITTEHSTMFRRRDNWFVRSFSLEKFVYQQYARVICISQEVFSRHAEQGLTLEKKCVVINNGVDLSRFSCDYNVHFRLNGPIIICVGTLCENKDQFTLIRAISHIPNVKLWLVGDGPSREDLENLILQLQLQEKVFLLGKRSDIPDLLKKCTIYVQPSYHEGFSIAMIEALASGLPIVASNVPGMKEIVQDADLLFPFGDEKALAEIIARLLSNPSYLTRLSDENVKKAQKYSINETVKQYCKLYMEVIKKNNRVDNV